MNSADVVDKVSRHINANMSRYFPLLEGVEFRVRLISEQRRASASLYRFEVASQEGRINLFAKGVTPTSESRPEGPEGNERVDTRPRLSPGPMERGEKTRLEYYALKAIYQHFGKLANPALGAIHVLDYIEQPQTIIMVENTDPTLRSLYTKANRLSLLRPDLADLHKAFFNAGAWLKAFAALPGANTAVTRLPGRDDFQLAVMSLTEFLGRVSGDATFFQRVQDCVVPAAEKLLPDELPLGIGHGDYAMRNLLVGTGGRITAFDTCARWRVPLYEDIAYFLVQLEINGLQILTQGLGVQARLTGDYQRQFLAGYFGSSQVPSDAIQLFQVQLLLDSWSSQLSANSRENARARGIYRKLYLTLLNRRYRSVTERLLNAISTRS